MKLNLLLTSIVLLGASAIAPILLRSSNLQATPAPEITIADNDGHHRGHDGHSPRGGSHGHDGHSHGSIAVPPTQPIPSVSLIVHPDSYRGWNLEIQVENFQFAPERVNLDGPTTEGHAHLFLNGQKVTRLYGTWYYLPELPSGRNKLKVTLNDNQHRMLMHEGKPIEAMATVNAP